MQKEPPSSSSFFRRRLVQSKKRKRGFRIWKNKEWFHTPWKKKSPLIRTQRALFFLPSWHFVARIVARFCRKRRSALPLSCSLCLSLCLLPALCRFERRNRSRGEGEREGGGASTASRFGKEFRRYARLRLDFSKSLSFFFIAGVRWRGSTLKTRGGIQQSVEKRQSRHY